MIPTLKKGMILAAALAAPVAMAAPFPRLTGPVQPDPGLSLPDGSLPDLSLTETWCDLRPAVGATLRHDFAEEPRLAALTGAGLRMELWTSDLMGSWTLVHHGEDGVSCIVTSGMDWSDGTEAVKLMDRALAEAVYQS